MVADKDTTQEFDEDAIMKETLTAVEELLKKALAEQDARRAEELRQLEERISARLVKRGDWWKSFIRNIVRRFSGIVESELREVE